MIYVVDPHQWQQLLDGERVRVSVRRGVGPGHRVCVGCGVERLSVRVVSVERGAGLVRAVVEVGE